jgi:hypothetical protein
MASKMELIADNKYLKDQLVGVYLVAKEIEDNLEGIRHAIAAESAVSLETIRVQEEEVTRLNNYLLEVLHGKLSPQAIAKAERSGVRSDGTGSGPGSPAAPSGGATD